MGRSLKEAGQRVARFWHPFDAEEFNRRRNQPELFKQYLENLQAVLRRLDLSDSLSEEKQAEKLAARISVALQRSARQGLEIAPAVTKDAAYLFVRGLGGYAMTCFILWALDPSLDLDTLFFKRLDDERLAKQRVLPRAGGT